MTTTTEGNPYLIHPPAIVNFSGGRSSAYMLISIIAAHGGTLPEGVHVCFSNTGKEREESLAFVQEVSNFYAVRSTGVQRRFALRRVRAAQRAGLRLRLLLPRHAARGQPPRTASPAPGGGLAMPDAPELRPGMVVRWTGVSPDCWCPDEHPSGPNARPAFIGKVTLIEKVNPRYRDGDHCVAVAFHGSRYRYWCRPDEVTPVDEWGIDAPDVTTTADLPLTMPVGVNA